MTVLPELYTGMTTSARRAKRLAYAVEQRGMCAHCGYSLNDKPIQQMSKYSINWKLFPRGLGFLDHPVHLHHDHKTGVTIGAVHAYCNAVLFQHFGE